MFCCRTRWLISKAKWRRRQQALTQGQTLQQNLRQLALRLYSDSQKTGDQGLKDILARQQISFKSNDTGSTNATDMPAAPSSSSTH